MSETATMTVEVWSDVVCPWCCIGKAHLEQALSEFDHAVDVEVVWRSYELDPDAPAIRNESIAEQLAVKYGEDSDEISAMLDSVTKRAAGLGLDFRFDQARSGNTLDAHRLLHLAKARGLQAELKARLFAAYFTEGEAIGDPATLERLAIQAGLEPGEVREVLGSDLFADDVRADEAEARELQVSGVPFFVFDRRLAVPGAQPPDRLLGALQQAWALRSE